MFLANYKPNSQTTKTPRVQYTQSIHESCSTWNGLLLTYYNLVLLLELLLGDLQLTWTSNEQDQQKYCLLLCKLESLPPECEGIGMYWLPQYLVLDTCIIINYKIYLKLLSPCENSCWKMVSVGLQPHCRGLSSRAGVWWKLRCLKFCRNSDKTPILLACFQSWPSYLLDAVSTSCYCHIFTSFESKQIQQTGDKNRPSLLLR